MVDLLRASFVQRAAVFSGFCLALATVFGCASGSETQTSNGALGTGGSGGHATTSSTGGKGGFGGGGGSGGAGGAPLSGKLEVCVLNTEKEDGQCETPAQLDFGTVMGGSETMRLFRIDNGTNKVAELDKASIASNEFKVATVRYEDDPGNPGHKIRVVQALPETRKPGESLWFEVSWDATGTGGPIPANKVLVLNKVDSMSEPDLVVPMVGTSDGCPAGTAACDSDPTNGCETNTSNDPNNCGACNKKCNILNGTGGCMNGQCVIQSCNAGFADCDLNPNNGCETNTLNDPMHCGTCMQDCTKHTQQANCVGGNCNIVTCATGYADCNLNPNDGCETNVLGTDNANCGGCNIACAPAHANGICQGGMCNLGACAPGYQDCDMMAGDGCEVNTDNDPQHCGSCGHACSFPNAGASCSGGTCLLGACDPNFSDCDGNPANGCEANLQTDNNHCGGCGIDCPSQFANSQTQCAGGGCQFVACLPNFYNLDGNIANGCEYACTYIGAVDNPDDSFIDRNCDGIDGDITKAIFVATNGSDSNPGTMALPMLTINGGIAKAAAVGLSQVYVSEGTYVGRVILADGISIYGGYSANNNWARGTQYTTIISSSTVSNGRVSAVEGSDITSNTTVDRFTITTGSTSQAGVSNYGMYCDTCTGLNLKNSVITAGSGGGGAPGSGGSAGLDGVDGTPGANGSCDNAGGGSVPGGSRSCNGTNVSGGTGGAGGPEGSNNGSAGGTGQNGGTAGGGGGAGCNCGFICGGCAGSPGGSANNAGAVGTGSDGSGASGGGVAGGFWTPNTGGNGTAGPHGKGGGGGGGGGGQGGTDVNDGGGNGGGGGGSGGCGGTAATGGGGGGGSFGLFLVASNGIALTNNTITGGNGGAGGTAGAGGSGGARGNGAAGATQCTGEVGAGGDGGNGSNGGRGGHGGGGAGGVSYGVYRSGTAGLTLPGSNNLNHGNGGNGGTSPGNAGAVGAAANFI